MTTVSLPGLGALPAARVFVGRSLRQSLREPDALIMAIALPVLLMLLFSYVFGGALGAGVGGDRALYAGYVTPGIILLCSGFGAANTAVSVSRDMATGTVNRLRTMPIPAATALVGHVVTSVVRNLFATAVVVGVGIAAGFRPSAGIGGWLAAAALIVLWILAITTLFALIGLFASSPEAAQGYTFGFMFLPYVSSAFVPVSTMPGWLRGFAGHQPITPVIESIRSLLAGRAPGADALLAVAWSVGIALAAAAVIVLVFPRRVSR